LLAPLHVSFVQSLLSGVQPVPFVFLTSVHVVLVPLQVSS